MSKPYPEANIGPTKSSHRPTYLNALCGLLSVLRLVRAYGGLPWCRTQSGMLEPAKDVLGVQRANVSPRAS